MSRMAIVLFLRYCFKVSTDVELTGGSERGGHFDNEKIRRKERKVLQSHTADVKVWNVRRIFFGEIYAASRVGMGIATFSHAEEKVMLGRGIGPGEESVE